MAAEGEVDIDLDGPTQEQKDQKNEKLDQEIIKAVAAIDSQNLSILRTDQLKFIEYVF